MKISLEQYLACIALSVSAFGPDADGDLDRIALWETAKRMARL